MPWLIMGDFNSVLETREKIGGSQVNSSQVTGFQDCVTLAGALDMRYTRNYLTWSDRQAQRISSKPDSVCKL